jgi:hypothetical protein
VQLHFLHPNQKEMFLPRSLKFTAKNCFSKKSITILPVYGLKKAQTTITRRSFAVSLDGFGDHLFKGCANLFCDLFF